MKKSEDRQKTNPVIDFIKGALVGSGVIASVTPMLYWKNMRMLKKKPVLKDCTRGILLNGASYVPTSAVAIAVNSMLLKNESADAEKVAVSVISGALSGAISCVPENLVQNKQATKESISVITVLKKTVRSQGLSALFRGNAAVMAREGLFAPCYLTFVPMLSEAIKGVSPNTSVLNDLVSSVIAGTTVGLITTPMDLMRAIKQANIANVQKAPTYAEIVQKLGWRGCLAGAKPRAMAVVSATFLMTQGMKAIKEEVKEDTVTKKR